MTNQPTCLSKNRTSYSTLDLKLASLLLAELPDSLAEVSSNGNSNRKMIHITFPEKYQADVNKMISDYINKEARVDVFRFNKSLNVIRDKIKSD